MKLTRFSPPANINDFPSDSGKAEQLCNEWSQNIGRWTATAIIGDPWQLQYDKDRAVYYNPVTQDMPTGIDQPIKWNAFPARIKHTFPGVADTMQYYQWADQGGIPDPEQGQPYTPTGDRGWQDEYCEWSVTRNEAGKMIRVDFTCENSEYWFTLWRVDPKRVLQLYQDIVGPQVSLDDLTIKGKGGAVVNDPSTGQPAYEPLNKWNSSTSTGAVHLISSPNTLGAEIYLAAAATLQRNCKDPTEDQLIQCAKYGREFRNSDPHIGFTVNSLVKNGVDGKQVRITLTDPVGLYMQWPPDSSSFQFADPAAPDLDFSTCWSIFVDSQGVLRGDPKAHKAVHLRFELPKEVADKGYTLDDLQVTSAIDGNNYDLKYGSQIVESITMMLVGHAVTPAGQPAPPVYPCVEDLKDPVPMVQAFLPSEIYAYQFANHTLQVALTPRVEHPVMGRPTTTRFTLLASDMAKNARLVLSNEGITLTPQWDTYKPGTGDDAHTATVEVDVTMSAFARLGDVSLQIVNPDGRHGPPMPSVLEVVDSIIPQEGAAADASVAADAVMQTSLTAIRTNKSRPRRR